MQKKTEKVFIELIFWCALILISSPLILERFFNSRLENYLSNSGQMLKEWRLKQSNADSSYAAIAVPHDLQKGHYFSRLGTVTYETSLSTRKLESFIRPGIVLGRIGDSDTVTLNDCLIGSTGVGNRGEPNGWWWGHLRYYEIPRPCIPGFENGTLKVVVTKLEAPGESGMYEGPIGIGENETLSQLTRVLNWLRIYVPAIYGLVLILGVGTYYGFVYFLFPGRRYNGAFAICALSIGAYEIVTSGVPYQLANDFLPIFRLNFLAATATASSFIWFLTSRWQRPSSKFSLLFLVISTTPYLASLFFRSGHAIYTLYQGWFLLFLIGIFTAFAQFLVFRELERITNRPIYFEDALPNRIRPSEP